MGREIIKKLEKIKIILGRTAMLPEGVTLEQCRDLTIAYRMMSNILNSEDADFIYERGLNSSPHQPVIYMEKTNVRS